MFDKGKEVKSEEKKVKKEAKNKAFEILKELVDKQTKPEDKKYKDALITIRPSLYGIVAPGGGHAASDKFIAFIEEKKSVNEEVVFKEFKIGRKEAAVYIRKHLKKVEPKDRIWINFDRNTGIYKVEGKGEKVPGSYNGFIPVDEKIDLGKQEEK
jgi:bisphosphoglycerate-independent phosphoglycerate mutase (AlkP superfamily)